MRHHQYINACSVSSLLYLNKIATPVSIAHIRVHIYCMATVHADACCITGATAGFTYFQITLQHQFFDETVSKTETKIFDFLHHGCVRYLLVGAWLRHACGYGCCCICWEYVCIIIASSSSRSGSGSTAAASTAIPSSKLIPSPTTSGRQHVETWLGCRYHGRNVCWNVRAVLAFYRTGDQAARPSIHPRHRYAGETEAHHTECVQPPPFSVLLFFLLLLLLKHH